MSPAKAETLAIHPLTPNRWDDFALLFGKNGACAGRWCLWWQMGQSDWLARSKILAPVDDVPVLSVTCFFVRRKAVAR